MKWFSIITALAGVASLAATAVAEAPPYGELVRETPGLLLYLPLDDAEMALADRSGHSHAVTAAGGTTATVASSEVPLGRAMRLDGGHIRLPDLGTHDAVSIELWIKLTRPAAGITAIYAADGWSTGLVHLNLRAGGSVELAVNGVGGFLNAEPETLAQDRWRHLVATYDRHSGQQRLFRDGRLIVESSVQPAPQIKLLVSAIGAWYTPDPTRSLSADIDEVAIYSAALSPSQIRAHYLAGRGLDPAQVDFAGQVLPLLKRRCFGCHGDQLQENGLRLDIRDAAHRGGESGEPALIPFDADASELIRRVSSGQAEQRMPPDGAPLAAAEIALLRNWIDCGAAWPDALAGKLPVETVRSEHWSFQRVKKPVPPVSDEPPLASGNAIDAFIDARLRARRIERSPEADARTLVRRLYLDVHGLPPDPDEVRRFAAEPSPQAWEAMVDRVLASPRYGERWASHWLDVIRYGETHGFEVNTPRENAWPYRDWLIASLNADKPYDRFLLEQIAGDQLGSDAATGFLVAAPALLSGQTGKDLASIRQARQDELHEVIVSVSAGVLGLSAGCARCHNHKFDPISQRDYYQLQAVFAGLHYGERPLRKPVSLVDASSSSLAKQTPSVTSKSSASPAQVFAGSFTSPEATYRLYRGDPMQRRERVAPNVPAVLGSLSLESTASDSERRLALAHWLVEPSNPLTARVIVNRVWQHHFGTGLVASPSDFGTQGSPPSHPQLLDWLAATLVEDDWSLKRLHRRILLSNTYRRSSRPRSQALALDAQSRLLWRFPPRRLAMEPIRDSILATSGALDLSMGGLGFSLFKPNTNYVRVYDPKEKWGPAEWRRMIYAHRVRMAQDGVFGALDCPDAGQPAPRRSISTTAIQALNLLNSSFMRQQAELFARRAEQEATGDLAAQIRRVFWLAYARLPSDDEQSASLEVAQEFGLRAVCLAVLNSNEFLFLP